MASRRKAKGAQGPWPHTGPRKPAARHARKHGGPKRRLRRKIHLGIDEQTLEVRAVESSPAIATGPKEPVDGSHIGDAPFVGVSIHWIDPWSSSLPELLAQIPADEEIGCGEPRRTPTVLRPGAPPVRG